jgi:predicted nuclease of predicted toxin-antitoxin system
MKFLIDECLSPDLAKLARDRGYGESTHVNWMGLSGRKDWSLKPFILDGDWTFVTKNSIDFRGPAGRPGTKGQYADVVIHAGLVCLNAPEGMDLDLMIELFETALDELEVNNDLVNQVLEITAETDSIHIGRYALPAPGSR